MIPVYEPYFSSDEEAIVLDCLRTKWISSLGEYIPEFEQRFAEICGSRHAVSVCNGTAALYLALYTLGVGPGDEVILPSLTFVATANAVHFTGATPVFVDVEKDTWNISVSGIEKSITPNTKAIVPVHLYGLPANMDEIRSIADTHKKLIVEDAAEAHFASINGQYVGTIGDVGIFSFYGNKIITTGEGGMIVTNNDDIATRARFLRDHAMSRQQRYWHTEPGFNYRMTNIQAAIGLAQLRKLNFILARKAEIADQYRQVLETIPGISLRHPIPGYADVCWLFSLIIEPKFPMSRDALIAYLRDHNIDSRPFFVPLHLLPMYNNGIYLPVSVFLGQNGLSLPSSPCLTSQEIEYIVSVIQKAANN